MVPVPVPYHSIHYEEAWKHWVLVLPSFSETKEASDPSGISEKVEFF
jgi:predicted metalloenzyme YecM